MRNWDIDPYAGVGEIEFGMSSDVVSGFLGPAVSTEERSNLRGLDSNYARYYQGLKTEFRELPVKKEPVISLRDDRVELIDFVPSAKKLQYKDILLFSLKRVQVVESLMELSQIVLKDREGFMFLDFGITLSSQDHYRDNPNIGVFCRGHFDALIEKGLREGKAELLKGDYRPMS